MAPSAAADGVESERRATLWTVERVITTTSHRPLEGRPVPLPVRARWVIGALAGAGGLVALAVTVNERIEAELEVRTEGSLRDAGLDPSGFEIEFDFRDGIVRGSLPDDWSDVRFQAAIDVDGARRIVFEPPSTPRPQDTDS